MELPPYACHACVARIVMFVANFRKIVLPVAHMPIDLPRNIARLFAPRILANCNEPEDLRQAAILAADATSALCLKSDLSCNDKPEIAISLSEESAPCLLMGPHPSLRANLEAFLQERTQQELPYMECMLSDRSLMIKISRFLVNRQIQRLNKKLLRSNSIRSSRGELALYTSSLMRKSPEHQPQWLRENKMIGSLLATDSMSDHDILVALQSASAENASETHAIRVAVDGMREESAAADEAVITGINAIHNRLNHKSSGRLGSTKIGQDERRKAYEIWEEAKRKLKPTSRRLSFTESFNSPMFNKRLLLLGISSPNDFKKAIETERRRTSRNANKGTSIQ